MDQPPVANASSSSLVRLWPWFSLMLVILFVGFIRYRLLDMPLERDEGEYAYAGQLILQGIPPYELAYNMKLPGTYYACALGMALFGQTAAGIHATLIVINSLTIVFVFLLARKLFSPVAAVAAAASYGMMSVSPFVLGMATHANHFVVLFAVPATLALWQGLEKGSRKLIFFSGLLYGLAFLMKQQGLVFAIFGGVCLLCVGIRRRDWLNLFGVIALYAAGIILPFLILCCEMARDGNFSRFWFWTFTYAHSYIALTSVGEGAINWYYHVRGTFYLSIFLWLLGIAGLVLGFLAEELRIKTAFLFALWFFSFCGTAAGFYFRGHYFILLLPAFSLLIALALEALPRTVLARASLPLQSMVPLALFAVALGWNTYHQRQLFLKLPGLELFEFIYADYPFIEAVEASNYIREHSAPTARIAVLGSEPEIYFYSQRHSATGYIYTYALVELQPNAARMQKEMISEIESAKPEFLVWVGFGNSWLLHADSDLTIVHWFNRYASLNYYETGILNVAPDGTISRFWGKDIVNFHDKPGQYVTVFQRRDLATTPVSGN